MIAERSPDAPFTMSRNKRAFSLQTVQLLSIVENLDLRLLSVVVVEHAP